MARPRRSHDVRERLLDTGVTMLSSGGYHGTGLKQILDEVGVPKGSFYNYFESKEDFGAEVIRRYGQGMAVEVEESLRTENKDAFGALKRYFKKLIRKLDEQDCCGGCLVGNLGGEMEASSELVRTALAETIGGWRKRIAQAIGHAQEQGAVRDDLTATELSDILVDAWEGGVIRTKIEGNTRPLKQSLKLLLDEFFQP